MSIVKLDTWNDKHSFPVYNYLLDMIFFYEKKIDCDMGQYFFPFAHETKFIVIEIQEPWTQVLQNYVC